MRLIPLLLILSFSIAQARYDRPPSSEERPPLFTPQLVDVSVEDYERPATDEGGEVFFVDESLDQVLKLLGELTSRKIIAPESLPDPVFNFDSQGDITKEEAIVVIESLLSMNGVAVAEMGDRFLRVIPTTSIKNKSPDLIERNLGRMEPSEKMYTKLFKVKYMKWEDVTQMVNNRLSPNGAGVELYESSKSFIVTDTLVNLQRVESLLNDLDVYSEKKVLVKKLTYILAADLKTVFEESLADSLTGFVSGSVSIQADVRSNQMIITTSPENLGLFEDLIESYDVDTEPLTSSKVVHIKHAESSSVVSLLQSIISSQKNPDNAPRSSGVEKTPRSDDKLQTKGEGEDTGKLQFSKYLSLVADERSNAVVIYGTKSDIEFVSNLIEDIDVLLAQVKIDVVIAEVTLTDEDSRGLESFGISYDENDEVRFQINEGSDTGWSMDGSLEDIFLRSWTVTGFTLATVFDTAKRDTDVKVLSAPTLVTTHNREASINAGESRPIITSSNTDSTGLNTRSQVQYKDIGIQLKVKPMIGSNGVVQMEIEQIVESVVDEVLIDGNSQPVIGTRQATSFVSVHSGEMIVLAGLQESSIRNTKGKMAFLGNIPIFGSRLFSSNRERSSRRELVIFLRPTVYFDTGEQATDIDKYLNEHSESLGEILREYNGTKLGNDSSSETENVKLNSEETDFTEVLLRERKRRHF